MARHACLLVFGLICAALGGCDTGEGGTEPDGTIRGTLLWADGSETELELAATHWRLPIEGATEHTCSGEDSEGFALSVSWTESTPVGTSSLSLGESPSVLVGWPVDDSSLMAGASPREGKIVFDAVGTDPGDEVAGTASVSLHSDPLGEGVDRVVDISFSCIVSE